LVIILDGSNVPAVDGPAVLLSGGVIVVRIILVAGFLKMVLQLLFCIAAALTHGTHLLRRWCGVGVLVRTMILRIPAYFLAHSEIVPLDVGLGKLCRSRKGWMSVRSPERAGPPPSPPMLAGRLMILPSAFRRASQWPRLNEDNEIVASAAYSFRGRGSCGGLG
jgi:hypothetical protein